MSTRSNDLREALRAYLRYLMTNNAQYDDYARRRSLLCARYGVDRVRRLYARYRPRSIVLAVADDGIVYRREL